MTGYFRAQKYRQYPMKDSRFLWINAAKNDIICSKIAASDVFLQQKKPFCKLYTKRDFKNHFSGHFFRFIKN